jgi:hypothetical protein
VSKLHQNRFEGGDVRFELLGVEGVRIEVVAQPLQGFGVALVAGIFERFEHFALAPGAADVFGRATAGRLDVRGPAPSSPKATPAVKAPAVETGTAKAGAAKAPAVKTAAVETDAA